MEQLGYLKRHIKLSLYSGLVFFIGISRAFVPGLLFSSEIYWFISIVYLNRSISLLIGEASPRNWMLYADRCDISYSGGSMLFTQVLFKTLALSILIYYVSSIEEYVGYRFYFIGVLVFDLLKSIWPLDFLKNELDIGKRYILYRFETVLVVCDLLLLFVLYRMGIKGFFYFSSIVATTSVIYLWVKSSPENYKLKFNCDQVKWNVNQLLNGLMTYVVNNPLYVLSLWGKDRIAQIELINAQRFINLLISSLFNLLIKPYTKEISSNNRLLRQLIVLGCCYLLGVVVMSALIKLFFADSYVANSIVSMMTILLLFGLFRLFNKITAVFNIINGYQRFELLVKLIEAFSYVIILLFIDDYIVLISTLLGLTFILRYVRFQYK